MTPQEALNDIKTTEYRLSKGYIKLSSFYLDNFNKVVESALEKQIPKKVEQYLTSSFCCPICTNVLSRYSIYCANCGQALDWSDTE